MPVDTDLVEATQFLEQTSSLGYYIPHSGRGIYYKDLDGKVVFLAMDLTTIQDMDPYEVTQYLKRFK